MRATRVVAAVTPSGGLLLFASLGSRADTLVLTVDQASGEVVHAGIPGQDVFASEDEALRTVSARLCGGRALPTLVRGQAFLGLVVTPVQAMVLVAVEVRRDPLPAGHQMCTVVKSQWVKAHAACAKFGAAIGKNDETGLERLRDFAVSGHHFYSETVDLTRPFPSTKMPADYDPEYCWNQWLAEPFERAGLRGCCVVLLQGLCCSRTISCADGVITLALITRKSIANPGTRYNSRGLNDIAGAGNELESEQLVWVPADGDMAGKADDSHTQSSCEAFSSHLWRRGTVPVHWRHELTSSVTAPKIVIAERPYDGVDEFFLECNRRYGGLGMTFINLLRCDTESGETGLSEVFQQSLREARARLAKRGIHMELSMCNFDWHRLRKEVGLQSTVRGLWDRLGPMLHDADLTAGNIRSSQTGRGHPTALQACEIIIERRQRAISRFNCADSLDRTNLCCFMVSQQILLEQCRRLRCGLQAASLSSSLPVSIDLQAPWAFLKQHAFEYEHVRRAFEPRLLEWLAEAYVRNGDIFSQLYTCTPALATGAMREFTSLPPAQSDAIISTQRRYHNVLGDTDRQCQYLTFLGRYLARLLPCQDALAHVSSCYSSPGAASLQPVPSETQPSDFVAQVLDAQASEVGWISPADIDVLDSCISLRLPCTVTEVQLTVKNGISSTEFPTMLSIWVGAYVDNLTQVYGNVMLPMCDDGTRLSFPVPSHLSRTPARELAGGQIVPETLALSSDDAQTQRNPASISRVVRVQLGRSPGSARSIIVGRISVLGQPAGGAAVIGDSGVNLLANRLADDSIITGDRNVGNMSESLSNMMEKKLADGASRTARELGGKALAKADRLVDKYAGDDSKLGNIAKGAISSISKFSGWMAPKKAAADARDAARPAGVNDLGSSVPMPAAAGHFGPGSTSQVSRTGVPVGSRCEDAGASAGAASASEAAAPAAPSAGIPDWMRSGGGGGGGGGGDQGSGGGDVASQLAAMWGQQAAGRAWGKQAATRQRAPAGSTTTPAPAPEPEPGALEPSAAAARNLMAAPVSGSALGGGSDFMAMERALMAESRGARGPSRAAPQPAAFTESAAAASSDPGDGRVDPLSGAPLDPLGGMVVHGGNFGVNGDASEEDQNEGGASGVSPGDSAAAAGADEGRASATAESDEFARMLLELDCEQPPAEERQVSVESSGAATTTASACQAAAVEAHAAAVKKAEEEQAAAAAKAKAAKEEEEEKANAAKAAAAAAAERAAGAKKAGEEHKAKAAENEAASIVPSTEIVPQVNEAAQAPSTPASAYRLSANADLKQAHDSASALPILGAEVGPVAVQIQADDAHVLRKDVCSLVLQERRARLQDALRALRACGEGAVGGADVHRLVAGCAAEFDGHNKGGRRSEGGRVAHSSAECEAVTAAATALSSALLVTDGYKSAVAGELVGNGLTGRRGVARREQGWRVVSQYPLASIVLSVPTAVASLPVESILMPEKLLGLEEGCWMAPQGVEEVSLHVCLSHRADIHQIEMVVPCAEAEGSSDGFKADDGLELRMTVEEHLVHGARSTSDNWQWNVAAQVQEDHAGTAMPGSALCFRPPTSLQGRVLRVHARVAPGRRLRIGRLRVVGIFAVHPFSPPPALVGSSESVAHTTLTALLQARAGAAPLKGVRASLREGGCGGTMGACNGEGLALDLIVEAGTPITGIAVELRPPQSSGLPAAAGSAGAAVAAALSAEVGALHSGTPLTNQPAEVCLLVMAGGGGQVGGRGACDVRLDARLPLVLAPATLYFALPAPAVAGHVSLLLGRSYGGGWCDKSSLKHLGVQLYSFKLTDA